jgi:CBS-domain-containing membrane protein
VKASTSLYNVCQIFVESKAQRCPVVDESGKVIRVVTQADVLDFVADHMEKTLDSAIGVQTVTQLHIGTRPVITINRNMRTLDAYKLMYDHKISGLGIVDDSGVLIGNLSTRDLKYLDPDHILSGLQLSTALFNEKIRDHEVNERNPAISCSENSDLAGIIKKMAVNHIHRLYICSQHLHPLGIISLRDIIATLLKL